MVKKQVIELDRIKFLDWYFSDLDNAYSVFGKVIDELETKDIAKVNIKNIWECVTELPIEISGLSEPIKLPCLKYKVKWK